jgi:hypothetical protein
MGRNAARELARIVTTIGDYLDLADNDDTLPLAYEEIQKRTGVSRGHLSRRTEPEILALVARIAAIAEKRAGGAGNGSPSPVSGPDPHIARATAPVSEAPGLEALSEDGLKIRVRREISKIARLQRMWLDRHGGRDFDVSDAPLALFDADQTLIRLRAAAERLRPLVAEWSARRGIGAGALEEIEGGRSQMELI